MVQRCFPRFWQLLTNLFKNFFRSGILGIATNGIVLKLFVRNLVQFVCRKGVLDEQTKHAHHQSECPFLVRHLFENIFKQLDVLVLVAQQRIFEAMNEWTGVLGGLASHYSHWRFQCKEHYIVRYCEANIEIWIEITEGLPGNFTVHCLTTTNEFYKRRTRNK